MYGRRYNPSCWVDHAKSLMHECQRCEKETNDPDIYQKPCECARICSTCQGTACSKAKSTTEKRDGKPACDHWCKTTFLGWIRSSCKDCPKKFGKQLHRIDCKDLDRSVPAVWLNHDEWRKCKECDGTGKRIPEQLSV